MVRARHILIVEDEQPIAMMLQDIFDAAGYGVRHAKHGADALDSINETRPDIILLDVMMPKMDGREMIKRLQETEHSHIPVIVLTNNDQMEVIAEMLSNGAHDYIVKSDMTPQSLIRAVERRLKV